MPIKRAHEIDFSPPPRCPVCQVGILPYGNHEPLVVDAEGRVYCRDHAQQIEPTYPEVLAAYRQDRAARRLAAIRRLEEASVDEDLDVGQTRFTSSIRAPSTIWSTGTTHRCWLSRTEPDNSTVLIPAIALTEANQVKELPRKKLDELLSGPGYASDRSAPFFPGTRSGTS